MQFHHHGYISGVPWVRPAQGFGVDRAEQLPAEVDVLIVGAGPAGHIAAAQLAQFPNVNTRMIERRRGRLEVGQADGIQARSVETFQAFGFAGRITEEAYHITAMAFWTPDPADPSRIIRSGLPADDPAAVSEFPHLIVNQARVQDYFAEAMVQAPTRMQIDYGYEFINLEIHDKREYPVQVQLLHTAGTRAGDPRTVHAKYVIGCDGARSKVRDSIGRELVGDQAMHAWGVMDVLATTDFPDIRTKCAIQSHDGGSILLIPREGGYLFRMYVDLGEVLEGDRGAVRKTSLEQIIARANTILHPYTLDVRSVAWSSVYEVAHRLTDRFDDVTEEQVGHRTPRVFIAGDACHTHSAKAGQGMNVSMQDGFNIAWKLGHVLDGRGPESLLDTYSGERQTIARNLIDFDKQWSSLMAAKPEELENPSDVEAFYMKTFEFPAGFMTQYTPSLITGSAHHQQLATGFPVGKRFKSAKVIRVCDTNPVHIGHQATADGRWRLYVFADQAAPGKASALTKLADWLELSPQSPVVAYTPKESDIDAWFDVKVVYQQRFDEIGIAQVPRIFLPATGPFALTNYEKIFAAGPAPDGTPIDIFQERGIDRAGVVVIVRPDQYVSELLPLGATEELGEFFAQVTRRGHTQN